MAAAVGCLVAAGSALLIGFVAGFALFKRSMRWCPGCGWPLTPGHCRFAETQLRRPTGGVRTRR
jgi:hypothetical protein